MRTAVTRYRTLLVVPGVGRVFAASLIGRLPIGMAMLLFVLVVHAGTGSYAVGGLAGAANAAATALFGPPMGRLADRGHAALVLALSGLAQAAALGWLVIALHAHVAGPVVVVIAAVTGLVNPPIAAVTRTVLPRLAPDEQAVQTAFALDAILIEVTYLVGPALVGGVSALVDGYAATLLAAALNLIGAWWLATAPAVRHGYRVDHRLEPGGLAVPPVGVAVVPAGKRGDGAIAVAAAPTISRWRRLVGPLVSPGLLVVLAVSVLYAAAFGVLEVAIPAYMNARGEAAVGGLLFSVWSAGSIVGGLWFGGRDIHTPLHRQYTILMVLNLVGFTGILFAGGPLGGAPLTLAPLLFLAGLFISPTTAVEAALVTELAPRSQTTEAFTWSGTAIYLGFAFGSGMASVVMSGSLGSGGALATAAAFAVGLCAIGTVFALTGRRALAQRPVAAVVQSDVHASVAVPER